MNFIKNLFSPIKKLPPGAYNYVSPPEDPRNYRLHLRIEIDGSGILLVNGSTILHLNQTATEYAYYLIQNIPPEEAARLVNKRYNVNVDQALSDYQNFIDRIQVLINTPDLDPVTFLDFERKVPFSGPISAPYRLDCALSYQPRSGNASEFAPVDRVCQELTTDQWKKIIDKAWEVGIPHLLFTGGEPTLRDDLIDLLKKADENGQVTGIITDGFSFKDNLYLSDILQTGLDYILVIFQPSDNDSWIALKNLLAADIYVAIHLTITPDNIEQYKDLIYKLKDVGVKAISLSTIHPEMKTKITELHQLVSELNLELVWNLPVPYSELNPVAFETPLTQPGSGRAWLYLEPDGDVLPSQGDYRVIGNFMKDPWASIWANIPV